MLEPRIVLDAAFGSDYENVSQVWFQSSQLRSSSDARIGVIDGNSGGASRAFAGDANASNWIVRLTREATASVLSPSAAEPLLDQTGIDFDVIHGLGLPGQVLVSADAPRDRVESALSQSAHVANFELDSVQVAQVLPDDPDFDRLFGLENDGQAGGTTDADIDAPEAWETTTGSSNVVVAVIDSGIDYTHPDLFLNIWLNQGEIPEAIRAELDDTDSDGLITFRDLNSASNSDHVTDLNANSFIDGGDLLADDRWVNEVDDDSNGFDDDLLGWDFRDNDNDPFDLHRHGTHVAGTIGAIGNNGLGVSGVNWQTSMAALRFLDESNNGSTSDAIRAINYATMMRAEQAVNFRVTNNSWGTLGEFSVNLRDSIAASGVADILFVAGAGNGNLLGRGIDVDADDLPFYPASFDLPNIISVAASDQDDELALFSNFGSSSIDIAAPGVGVFSAEPGGSSGSRNGTSMATPHVAGTAALLWSHLDDATAMEVRDAILESAEPVDAFDGKLATGGRLSAAETLAIDTYSPRATLQSAPDITFDGGTSQTIEITLRDNVAVDVVSLDGLDLVVTRLDSADDPIPATLDFTSLLFPSPEIIAHYVVNAPEGGWQLDHNGVYEISLQAGAVADTNGNLTRAVVLGSFEVDIAYVGQIEVTSVEDAADADLQDGTSDDGNGNSTLRSAIQTANAEEGENTIVLDRNIYQFEIAGADEDAAATGDLDIKDDLTIIGAGATIDAAMLDRVFDVFPGVTLTLRDIMLTGGSAANGGAIRVLGGDVEISASTLFGSSASASGGAIHIDDGSATLTNVTISGNSATNGGAVDLVDGSFDLTHVTITNNSATATAGGIRNSGDTTLVNSIIAGNTGPADPDVSGDFTSDGNNLVGDVGDADGLVDGDDDNQVGDEDEPIDPRLGELTDNGGFTLTHALLFNSPAIDAANDEAAPETDQRLFPRPIDADQDRVPIADIGAVERFFAEIRGVKYHDLNQDGIRDEDEPGLAGWTIYLDLNHNGLLDLDEPRTITQADDPTTPEDEQGLYILEGLAADDYEVRAVLPTGWTPTAPLEPSAPGVVELSVLYSLNGGDGSDGSVLLGREFDSNIGRVLGVGDLNGDGFDDLALGARNENNGAGTVYVVFGSARGIPAEIQLADLVLGDGSAGFVVTGEEVSDFFGISLNVAGDLNGDGFNELVVGATNARYSGAQHGSVFVIFGREDFGASFDLTDLTDGFGNDGFVIQGVTGPGSGGLGYSINSAGDFNGDGLDDLLLRDQNEQRSFVVFGDLVRSEEEILLDSLSDSAGALGFRLDGDVRLTGAAGDINGDGFDDILLSNPEFTNYVGYSNAGIVYVVFGSDKARTAFDLNSLIDGDGSEGFIVEGSASNFQLGTSASLAGDLNGDGFDDLVIGPNYQSDYEAPRANIDIVIYGRGTGLPASIEAQQIIDGDVSLGTAIRDVNQIDYSGHQVRPGGDINGDGIDDLVIGVPDRREQYSGRTYVVFGSKDGLGTEFVLESLETDDGHRGLLLKGASVGGRAGTDVAVGDVNGDGFDDLLIGAPNASTNAQFAGEAYLWLAPGNDPRPLDAAWEVPVSLGDYVDGLDFGNVPHSAEITGQKFRDLNGNGEKDAGEVGVRDWKIYLDENDNNTFDNGETNVRTDSNGKYEFTDLEPFETYIVREESRGGWQQTFPAPEDDGEWVIELGAGELFANADFGNQDLVGGIGEGTAVIKGRLFFDFNGNGELDDGEQGLAGETVFIDSNNNGLLDEGANPEPRFVTMTDDGDTEDVDETGEYAFTSLGGGAYTVRVMVPDDSQQSLPLGNELASSEITAGDSPQAVTAADFNGDTVIDLAVANTVTNDVSILLGDGVGHFTPFATAAVGFGPQALAVADLDGTDGPDVIVGHQFSSFVSVLMNQGDGRFAAPANYTVGVGPRSVTVGDFDGINGPDLATVTEFNDRVSVLLNNGNGTFGEPQHLTPGNAPTGVTAADFDGNGTADLAVTNFDDDTVSIFVNDGSGNFFGPFAANVGAGPFSVTAAELNGDEVVDLVVANVLSDDVSILMGRGNGTFRPAIQRPAGIGPSSVSATDLDNDGDTDLAVTNASSKNLSVLRNLGDGLFQSPENFGIGDFPTALAWSVTAADIDNDGDADLAIANGEADTVSVLDNALVAGVYRILVDGDETIEGVDFGTRTINNPPTLNNIEAPEAIDEDADTQTISLDGIGAGSGEVQRLQVMATSSDMSLLDAVSVDYTSPDSTATVSLTPADDQSGTAIITVTVTDAGHDDDFATEGDNESTSRTFAVTVNAVDDPPTLAPIEAITVNANAGEQVVQLRNISAGGGESQALTLTATSDSPSVVPHPTIDYSSPDDSGSLRFSPASDGSGTAQITVTVSDGELTSMQSFDVHVNAAPVDISFDNRLVDENDAGVNIATVEVDDPNADDTHTFVLSDDRFEIVSGLLRLKSGKSLDHEQEPTVDLEITATDPGGLTASANFEITVQDINEFDPAVTDQQTDVSESVAVGTVIATATATDSDTSQDIRYSITGGDPDGVFEIDAESGAITVAAGNQLDHESVATWMLTVTATDSGSPGRAGHGTITLTVVDVNEHDPVVDDVTLSIAENSSGGAVVGKVAATDEDTSDAQVYAFTAATDRGLFAIDASNGLVTVAPGARLDHEAVNRHVLTVSVRDTVAPTRSTTATLTIDINDVNEFDPVLEDAEFRTAENREPGTFVGTVEASDADHSQSLRYEISGGNQQGLFEIDPDSGRMTIAEAVSLDHEESSHHELTVTATDSGTPALSDTAVVRIHVDDVNEFAPSLESVTFAIGEDAVSGTLLGTVPSSDSDTSQTLSLAITGGNAAGLFAIDSLTGVVTLAEGAQLDHEADARYDLFVIAIDNVVPIKLGTAVITIDVEDVNEFAPVVEDAIFNVAEDAAAGTVIGTVHSSDQDASSAHRFEITDGNTADAFAIDNVSGQITSRASDVLDHETRPRYTLTVRVVDDLAPEMEDFATVTIDVTDANEFGPVIDDASFSIAEDADPNSFVGQLRATDGDTSATLTFSLVGGNTAGLFAIDATTGELRLSSDASLDHEQRSVYELVVTVTEDQAPNRGDTATITVNITDVNERPDATGDQLATAEDTAVPLTLLGSDPEEGTLVFTVTTRPAHGTLSGDAPNLVYTPDADFFGKDSLVFFVSDGEFESPPATISIDVQPVNDSPTLDALTNIELTEDSPEQAITLTGISAGGGETQELQVLVETDSPALITGLTIDYTSAEQTAVVRFTPAADLGGEAEVSITVLDPGLDGDFGTVGDNAIVSRSFRIVVHASNEPPIAVDQTIVVDEDASKSFALSATDDESGPLVFDLLSTPDHGELSGDLPNIVYTPHMDYHGVDEFTFRVTDDAGLSDHGTVSIEVTPLNDSPAIDDVSAETNEDDSVVVDLTVEDVDGDPLTLRIVDSQTVKGSVAIDSDGKLTYDPSDVPEYQQLVDGESATETLVVEVDDGRGGTARGTVTLTVLGDHDHHNPGMPLDVDGNGQVVPLDVLIVVNFLNEHGSMELPAVVGQPESFIDTNDDGSVSPIDVLLIINELNGPAGSGEGPSRLEPPVLSNTLPDRGATPRSTATLADPSETTSSIPDVRQYHQLGDHWSVNARQEHPADRVYGSDSELEDLLTPLSLDGVSEWLAPSL